MGFILNIAVLIFIAFHIYTDK